MKKYSNIKFLVCSLALFVSLTSCRKEPLDIPNPNTRSCTTYSEQFEAVWQGIDHNYVLWSRDTVDWDARYEKYKPIFASFDEKGVDSATYVKTWTECTKGLLDHHMTIILWNPRNPGGQPFVKAFFPGRTNPNHTTDFDAQVSALSKQQGVTDLVTYKDPNGKFMNSAFCLLPGKTAGKHIAYFRFSQFNLGSLDSASDAVKAPFRAFYGDSLGRGIYNGAASRDDVESIIIDLRGNPGGDVSNISPLIVSLMQSQCNFGYSRYKQGLGRLDYTGWVPVQFSLPNNHLAAPKPIVMLADNNSISCAELSTHIIKSLPNGKVIGERTYGATCSLVPNTDIAFDVYYSGCFGDYNLYDKFEPTQPDKFAYYVYTSTYDMVTSEYKSLEGVGVQPDIEVLYDAASLASGVDNQLERALQYLRTNK